MKLKFKFTLIGSLVGFFIGALIIRTISDSVLIGQTSTLLLVVIGTLIGLECDEATEKNRATKI